MENNLDYIICDEKAGIMSSKFDCFAKADNSIGALSVNDVVNMLRKGDRISFLEFLEDGFDPDKPQFRLIRASRSQVYSYVFVEKDLRDGEVVNIIFLAQNIEDCAHLMSPDTQLYQSITGRTMYETLCVLADEKVRADYLTPEAFDLTKNALGPLKELSACRDPERKNAEMRRFCGIIIDKIAKKGYCGSPKISFSEENAGGSELGIYPVLPAVLVHTFMSAVYIMSFFSPDNRIKVGVRYTGSRAYMEFSAKTGEPITDDCTDFSELEKSHPELAYPAAVLRILAEVMDYSPSLHCADGVISLTFKVSEKRKSDVDFRFSDPYADIGTCVESFAALFGLSA